MAKKTKKAARILTKEKERLETRTEVLKKEGSGLLKETKLWTTRCWNNAQKSAVRANKGRMGTTQL
jgi:hypothetical protein